MTSSSRPRLAGRTAPAWRSRSRPSVRGGGARIATTRPRSVISSATPDAATRLTTIDALRCNALIGVDICVLQHNRKTGGYSGVTTPDPGALCDSLPARGGGQAGPLASRGGLCAGHVLGAGHLD